MVISRHHLTRSGAMSGRVALAWGRVHPLHRGMAGGGKLRVGRALPRFTPTLTCNINDELNFNNNYLYS